MTPATAALLFTAALVGGTLNSVAGGGSFFTFPALVLTGMGPVAANATSTVALWPGGLASTIAYRRELLRQRQGLVALSIASLVGGGLGAFLLLWSGDTTFARLVPWLLLVATVLFAVSGPLVPRLRRLAPPMPGPLATALGVVLQFVISVYGGYFGGGMGILMLAAFTLAGVADVHEANARKTWLGTLLNGVAIALFVRAGAVRWLAAAVMVVGAIVGGYGGAALARRIDPRHVRRLVVVVGAVLTVVFFLRA